MRTKYKQWAVDYVDEHPEIAIQKIDINADFFQEKPVIFEIGSGKGDFIAAISLAHPEYNYLAIERVKTVAGMMCKKLVEQGKYELARQICEGLGQVNANIVAQAQGIKDMMCQNTIQDLRDKLEVERTAAAAKQVEQNTSISQLLQNQYLVSVLRPPVVPAIVVGNQTTANNQPYPGFGFGIGGFGA